MRGAMGHHPSTCGKATIPLSFFCTLILLLLLPCCGASTCPKCGNITVPYPLSTSNACGDQLYKVVCNLTQGKLSLNAESGNYPIISINPSTQRLVVSSPTIAPKSCATPDLHSGGLVLDASLPFNVTSSNTILLLNCSSKLLFSPLNCSSNNFCSQFLAQDSEGEPCTQKLCCTFTAGGSSTSHKIGVADGDCTAYVSILGLNPSTPVSKWSYGIELEWASPLEPICSSQRDCGKQSTCQKDSRSNISRCFCNQGYQWSGSLGICTDETLLCPNGLHCGKNSHLAPLVSGITVGIVVCCVVAVVLSAIGRRRRLAKEAKDKLSKERQQILSEGNGGRSAKLYTSHEMKKATHNFAKERLLGSGGFGDVYKGVLNDGTVVAVKSAKVGNMKGIEQVLNEVRILSQVNHRGLVMLLGCCVETEQPLLVYEYISNGTLLDHLKGSTARFLDWRRRLKVAVQTAEGLAYLHSAANPPIYHRDVKSSNILLDGDLNAKVSDFGLSRLAQADLSHISTCAQGTLGYLDPEYYRNYQLTAKSDVYSFGVVLLELVTSQRAIEFARDQDDVNLAVYVAGRAQEGRIMEVVDKRLLVRPSNSGGFSHNETTASPTPLLPDGGSPELGADSNGVVVDGALEQSIQQVAFLALSCLRDSRSDRPSMKEVADELYYYLHVLEAALLGTAGSLPLYGTGFPTALGGVSAASLPVDGSFEASSSGLTSSTVSSSPHVFAR